MNIDDVRAFVAAVETGSVGKAALRLNLTQPAVTRRIQRLEQTLGVTLLDRDSKPARPTRAGESAYQRCIVILRATDELARETQSTTGPLRVGLSPAISESVFVPAIEAVRRSFPDLALRVTAERSTVLHKQVKDGQLDAAVVAGKPGRVFDDQRGTLLGTERVLVVAPREFQVGPRVKLADLAAQPWVINPDGCGFRVQLDRAVANCGAALNVIAEMWGTALQLALIARGIGLGIVPERLLAESPHRHRVRVLTVDDFAPALDIWQINSGPLGALALPVEIVSGVVRGLLSADAADEGRRSRNPAPAK